MKIRKNGKVITLSESDLRRIVKRVMNEGEDPKNDLVECCDEAGIKPPKSCVDNDVEKCIKDVGNMMLQDPIGMASKVGNAVNCLAKKSGKPGPMQ
jgi:hypothetical protein